MAVAAVGTLHGFKSHDRSQRCRLLSFTHLDFLTFEPNPIDMSHSKQHPNLTTSSSGFHRSISTPCLTLTPKPEEDSKFRPRIDLIGGRSAPRARALAVEVAIATASGIDPELLSNGLGGAYLLRGRNGDNLAVAKPIDEEPLALNNPKGFTGRMLGQPGLKRSVKVGETGMRELAAYLLDHGGFAKVPPTALVKFSHVVFNVNDSSFVDPPLYKIASLQRFVDHDSDAGDLGPSGFSVSSVHRIGILDVRLLNIDRHAGNMLVGKYQHDRQSLGAAELVPIDHGLCLPEWLDDPYFEWLHWPQALVPFSDVEMEYIMNLDPFEDAKLLRTELHGLGEASIRVLVVCTIFLKRAASAGLCLGDIGEMMTRDSHGGEETMSVLESVCARAKDTVFMLSKDVDCGIDVGEEIQDDEEQGSEMFCFDEEFEDSSMFLFNESKVMQSSTSVGKPPLPPKPQPGKRAKLGSFPENECHEIKKNETLLKHSDAVEIKEHDDSLAKTGNLFKSISFAAPGRKDEIEGVSFGDMKEDEWEFFLEMLERLLPEVFEERKNTGMIQRVGSA
ncbi:phosphatidylinositol 4-kinase gamma 8-like [Silene latifolia]|uniref:phosphatidylinositol 4-kinase gamma 8-like n=1 Tax=Silene latifolia TaxID=37657 RepID=UPI003D787489